MISCLITDDAQQCTRCDMMSDYFEPFNIKALGVSATPGRDYCGGLLGVNASLMPCRAVMFVQICLWSQIRPASLIVYICKAKGCLIEYAVAQMHMTHGEAKVARLSTKLQDECCAVSDGSDDCDCSKFCALHLQQGSSCTTDCQMPQGIRHLCSTSACAHAAEVCSTHTALPSQSASIAGVYFLWMINA